MMINYSECEWNSKGGKLKGKSNSLESVRFFLTEVSTIVLIITNFTRLYKRLHLK